jgi:SAM-dependent methyltransferase
LDLASDCALVGNNAFFARPRRVLDFGCGGASLLLELASRFPSSSFVGFEPGPTAATALKHARLLDLKNLTMAGLDQATGLGPYDLVIVSHVIEHVLDFDLFELLRDLLAESGILYIEIPNPLQYESHERREFLYYFDRLHVNHFTPQALAGLAGRHGFGYLSHFEYAFPYRDGGEYPALGMVLRKGGDIVDLASPSILDAATRYVAKEQKRAEQVAKALSEFDGVLVWGAGDNFYRSAANGGPLCGLRNMVVLDRRPREIVVGDRVHQAIDPQTGIRSFNWPVVVTVSEGKNEISRQVAEIDPERRVVFV